MQLKFFSIPAHGESDLLEELNCFLRSHRVICIQKELSQREIAPCWRICVEYLEGSGSEKNVRSNRKSQRIDYREVLSEDDFAVFSRLRELRKELAAREAIPVYAVCTNDHLAKMATDRISNLSQFKDLDGFGQAKVEKYGQMFLAAINEGVSPVEGPGDET